MKQLPHLTLCYVTSRRDNRIAWFFASLARELKVCPLDASLIIVDFHARLDGRAAALSLANSPVACVHTAPKPTVWQGPARLTSVDYFAASSTRNTALCLARDGWIAYVDDLSVLMPGWLSCVREAMLGGYVALGAYKKVLDLTVAEDGSASCREVPSGVDSRWNAGGEKPVVAAGSWLFGCSLAAPVEAFLAINGWDEDADCCGLGGEDYICGMALQRSGATLRYDRRMLTLESEELHHVESPLKRVIEKAEGRVDASHVLLQMAMKGRSPAPNYFPPGGIRAERERVLRGEPFTPAKCPEHSWYSGIALRDL